MQYADAQNATNTSTVQLQLYYSDIEHELRVQVNLPISCAKVIYELNHVFQYIIYDMNGFIADVGGYLGLLLGQSIYGLYDIITNWLGYKMMKCGIRHSEIKSVALNI